MAKSDSQAKYHVAATDDSHVNSSPMTPWVPGGLRRIPWSGFLALLLAFAIAALIIAVVVVSNNDPIANWRVQPSVILAILSAMENILLHYALSESVTVAWWVKSLSKDARVVDLHNYWAYGTSLKSAVFAGKSFNQVGLAAILVAVAPISAPLLQRASTVGEVVISTSRSLSVPIALEIPPGYTGIVTGRGAAVAMVSNQFSGLIRNLARPLNVTGGGTGACAGTCATKIQAAGYKIECLRATSSFNLSSDLFFTDQMQALFNGTDVFSSRFQYSESNQTSFTFDALYKSNVGCDGDLQLVNCTLRPAVVNYHVVLTNTTIGLDPGFTYKDDDVVRLTPQSLPRYVSGVSPSTNGGLAFYLGQLYNSNARLRFAGAVGYDLSTSGPPASSYSRGGILDFNSFNCSTTWIDPTDDMLATARELAFRVSVITANSTNSTNLQKVEAIEQGSRIVYKSHYAYLAAALAVTIVAALVGIPLFIGWWHLGRSTSLSPIEIARAFEAPILMASDPNARIKDLLNEVGECPIQYGLSGESPANQKLGMAAAGFAKTL